MKGRNQCLFYDENGGVESWWRYDVNRSTCLSEIVIVLINIMIIALRAKF